MPRHLPLLVVLAATAIAAAAIAAVSADAKAPNDPTFTLLNRGSVPLVELYATPAGFAEWGRNRLNGREVAPQASVTLHPPANGNCIYDIRAVFADHRAEQRRGVNVCAVDEVAVGGAAETVKSGPNDPSFRLVNRGTEAISALYATPSGQNNWGQNRLRQGGLPPSSAEVIRIPPSDGCTFDLRVVMASGKALTKRHDDLCHFGEVPVP